MRIARGRKGQAEDRKCIGPETETAVGSVWQVGRGERRGQSGPGHRGPCGPVIRPLGLVLRATRRHYRVCARELQCLAHFLERRFWIWVEQNRGGRGLPWKQGDLGA